MAKHKDFGFQRSARPQQPDQGAPDQPANGPDVPLHFSAFHPDWKMLDTPPTPPPTLRTARRIATEAGLRYVYTGNIDDPAGQSTYCHGCRALLIGRDWYDLTAWNLSAQGRCTQFRRFRRAESRALQG